MAIAISLIFKCEVILMKNRKTFSFFYAAI